MIRIWKLSNAGCRASTSISRSAASSPNRSATYARSCSSVLMLSSAGSSASHSSRRCSALSCGEACGEDDPVVGRGVEVAHAGCLGVAHACVELLSVLRIVGARRRLDDEQTRPRVAELALHSLDERASDSAPLRGRIHGEPVQIVRALGRRRRAEAGVARAASRRRTRRRTRNLEPAHHARARAPVAAMGSSRTARARPRPPRRERRRSRPASRRTRRGPRGRRGPSCIVIYASPAAKRSSSSPRRAHRRAAARAPTVRPS